MGLAVALRRPTNLRHACALILACLIASAGSEARPATADLILLNGRVFTADPARPYVQALAIGGGRILAVGADGAVVALAGPATRRVDLKGHLVIPGFNDAHYHLSVEPRGAVEVDAGTLDPS